MLYYVFVWQFNVFMINWVSANDVGTVSPEKISRTHRKPSQNARLVGRQLCKFIQKMKAIGALDYSNVHLIGHDIGAHVAGYAGKCIQEAEQMKIDRITGK